MLCLSPHLTQRGGINHNPYRPSSPLAGFNTAALQGQTFQAVGAAGTQWDEHVAESVAAMQQQESEKEEAMGMDGGLEDAAQGEDQAVELQSRIRHKFGRDVMRVRAKSESLLVSCPFLSASAAEESEERGCGHCIAASL